MKPTFKDKKSCLDFLKAQLGDDLLRFEAYATRAEQWLASNSQGKSVSGLSNPYFDKSPCDNVTHQVAWIQNAERCSTALAILNRNNPNDPELSDKVVAKAISSAIAAWSDMAPYEGKR